MINTAGDEKDGEVVETANSDGIFFFLFPGFFGIMSNALQNQQFGDAELATVLSSIQTQSDIVLFAGLGLH